MMTQAQNEALTSVGPGTLMGEFMRQYWIPALKSLELAHADCDPVRVLLLGERLVAFRDTAGEVGLLAEACPHRGASLFLGRNEEGGLRCAYHGWKFDVHGACSDMPCEPGTGAMARKLRTRAYPCKERGGIVWTYMGPRTSPPPLPELEMNMGTSGEGPVDLTLVECNWLQNLDGDVDTDHITVLHGSNLEAFRATLRRDESTGAGPAVMRRARSFERLPIEVIDSHSGCTYACDITAAARRLSEPAGAPLPELRAIGQFILPFYAMLPYGALGAHWIVARVPMDDHHTMTFGMHSPGSAIPSSELMFGTEPGHLPNTPDWFGRYRLARHAANDFGLDRHLARSAHGPFALGAGVRGQAVQDAWITHSMGPVVDRTQEHLGPGDIVVSQVRKRLLDAARAWSERGVTPPGVDEPASYRVKQGVLRVRAGRTWRDELANTATTDR